MRAPLPMFSSSPEMRDVVSATGSRWMLLTASGSISLCRPTRAFCGIWAKSCAQNEFRTKAGAGVTGGFACTPAGRRTPVP